MQRSLFPRTTQVDSESNHTTFADNMRLPVHRWFRFSAGYSAGWVGHTIREELASTGRSSLAVLDPFAGSGTTLVAASTEGCDSVGWEAQTFIYRIAEAKLSARRVDPVEFLRVAWRVLSDAEEISANLGVNTETEPKLLRACYSPEQLTSLRSLQNALQCLRGSVDPAVWSLLWLDLVSILRSASHVGTAQWQYLLPKKSKARTVHAFDGFRRKAQEMAEDIEAISPGMTGRGTVIEHDARLPGGAVSNSIDLVVTSPPYANNFDYADATRLELYFWGVARTWSEMVSRVRAQMLTATTQQARRPPAVEAMTRLGALAPNTASVVASLAGWLETERARRVRGKEYDLVIGPYFEGMSRVLLNIRECARPGARIVLVIGDSAPYGIHVDTPLILAQLAQELHFALVELTTIRRRGTRWMSNGVRHQCPLAEKLLVLLPPAT